MMTVKASAVAGEEARPESGQEVCPESGHDARPEKGQLETPEQFGVARMLNRIRPLTGLLAAPVQQALSRDAAAGNEPRREGPTDAAGGPAVAQADLNGNPGVRLLHGVLDRLEDVRVGLFLPVGQVRPVGDVTGLRVFEVLVHLRGPAGGDEAALLLAGEAGGVAVGEVEELAHLVMDGAGGLTLPLRGLLPGGDVAGLGLAGEVLAHSGDPSLAEQSGALGLRHAFPSRHVVHSASISAPSSATRASRESGPRSVRSRPSWR